MKRKFDFSHWLISPKGSYLLEESRELQVGDNVIINREIYRIQEDPYDGWIECLYNNPHKRGANILIRFHEEHVDSIVNCDYEEY